MKSVKAVFSLYGPRYPATLIYMLQSTEYRAGPYLAWFWRTTDFNQVAKRRSLERTAAAKMLLYILYLGIALQVVIGVALLILGVKDGLAEVTAFGAGIAVAYPVVWAHLITAPLIIGRWFVVAPREQTAIRKSHVIFKKHSAITIAVAGSYGKTTMKEILLTVLGEGKKVAATPANKNVAFSHAVFAKKLKGDEDILIVEFGEGAPGDVKRFSETVQPSIGVITGLAPAHLDRYKTLDAAGEDIFSLADYLKNGNVYVNEESPNLKKFVKPGHELYDEHGALGWKVSNVKLKPSQTTFDLKKGKKTLHLSSGLIGRHQVGPLAFAAALADKLGLSKDQIEKGVAKTTPFEHRMQPRQLGGAWLIDDTYNGNIEGVRVGLELLKELPGKRKIYVTPGLVDQGKESEKVHREIGQLIAKAKPDQTVLMKNSVTKRIRTGLEHGGYDKSKVLIKTDPLGFYANLDQFIAAGDVILMQNDWTDNYN